MNGRQLALGALIAALAGCATTVVPTSEATPASADLSVQLSTPGPGKVAQVFKRDSGLAAAMCAQRLSLDAKPFADLRTGQMVKIYLEPGDYIVSAEPTSICGGGNAELQITVKPDTPRAYRVGLDQGGSIRIQPTAY